MIDFMLYISSKNHPDFTSVCDSKFFAFIFTLIFHNWFLLAFSLSFKNSKFPQILLIFIFVKQEVRVLIFTAGFHIKFSCYWAIFPFIHRSEFPFPFFTFNHRFFIALSPSVKSGSHFSFSHSFNANSSLLFFLLLINSFIPGHRHADSKYQLFSFQFTQHGFSFLLQFHYTDSSHYFHASSHIHWPCQIPCYL